jgi:archaemetzincin
LLISHLLVRTVFIVYNLVLRDYCDEACVITLIPIGEIDRDWIHFLAQPIEEVFRQGVNIDKTLGLSRNSWDSRRAQHQAELILETVPTPPPGDRYLAVVDLDIFAPGLNFVFGEAFPAFRKALISLERLRPEYYRQPPDEPLFEKRAGKEAIHELGHTYSLQHCPHLYCVMHYSNSIQDTDFKGQQFCSLCQKRLDGKLRPF